MIKKIHYVWLGGKPLPPNIKSCITSWKRHCPDWEIIQWNEKNFEIDKYRWVREAIECKKYAFAADFIRLYVLRHFGGAYLDTDVEILRPIESAINNKFVAGIENHECKNAFAFKNITNDGIDTLTNNICTWFCLQCGFMYSEPAHPFVIDCLNKLYDNGDKPFINGINSTNEFVIDYAMMCCLRSYGIKYRDETQYLVPSITIYKSSVFATRKSKDKQSYLIHWFDQSWIEGDYKKKIKKFIKKYFYFLYRLQ